MDGNKDNEGFQYLFSGKAESRYGNWLFLFVIVGWFVDNLVIHRAAYLAFCVRQVRPWAHPDDQAAARCALHIYSPVALLIARAASIASAIL